eukprot:gene34432-41674_t
MEAMSDSDELRKFEGWLAKLEYALKAQNPQIFHLNAKLEDLRDAESSVLCPESSALESLKGVLAADESQQPRWMTLKAVGSEAFVSTAADLRSRLRRLCLPVIMGRFEQLRDEVLKCSPFKPGSVVVDVRGNALSDDLTMMVDPKDTISSFCKLADYAHRIGVVSSKDLQKIDYLIRRETARLNKYTRDVTLYTEKRRYFEGEDDGRALKTALVTARKQYRGLEVEVDSALEEEERAKKAYEQAMARTQLARKKLEGFGQFMDLFHTQTELMSKLNRLRIMLAQFNQHSAERRIGMLKQLQGVYTGNASNYREHVLWQEGSKLLAHLAKQLEGVGNSIKEALSDRSSPLSNTLMVSLRVMLEVLRLYKALSGVSTASASPRELLDALEGFLRDVMAMAREREAICAAHATSEPTDQGKYTGQTVVLYYERDIHAVPEQLPENPLRVTTCLKLLNKRAQATPTDPSVRPLTLVRCEATSSSAVPAPPPYALLLTHSTQYLARLQQLSLEAQTEDLFVPLEFDTEWESDVNELSEEDGEGLGGQGGVARAHGAGEGDLGMVTRRARRGVGGPKKLAYNFHLHPAFSPALPATQQHTLLSLLSPSPTDVSLASCMQLQASYRREDGVGSIGGWEGDRVLTPYGQGVVHEIDAYGDEGGRVVVRLDWGAVAYMNTQSVTFKTSKTPVSAAVEVSVVKKEPAQANAPQDSNRFSSTDLVLHRRFR